MTPINKFISTVSICVLLLGAGCSKVLDKQNLAAVNSDMVWSNASVAEAYVNNIYAKLMPDNFIVPRYTDETMGVNTDYNGGLSAFLKGTLTPDSYGDWPYDVIRIINVFLAGIDKATFDDATKGSLKGQALFWRAWAYFRMVKAYGGVPLILASEAITDSVYVPRNKTSECIAQIVKDLDDAIPLLEDASTVGRIDKCAAMSFKGRVLLYWASPQFNRSNDPSRWTDAYNANKDALTFLNSMGKGLLDNYGDLWVQKMNKEVVMVKAHQYPDYTDGYSQAGMRPLLYSRDNVGGDIPSLELVNAYPMKDGSRYDTAAMDYRTFFQNRDQRFYASIAYNGAAPYIAPMFGVTNMWTYYYDADGDPATGVDGKEARADNSENLYSNSGFYPAKMLDRNITRANVEDGQVDWIEIRYAEVLMNMAEAANETGNTSDALSALYQIRQRAGIDAGGGSYGITAVTQSQIRQAIMDERFVEFAFEGQRFWDLRRWRIYAATFNNLKDHYLHGLRTEWLGSTASRPGGLTDVNTIWNQFSVTVMQDYNPIIVTDEDKYSFLGIPNSILQRNSNIKQTNAWGGDFDPLQ
jgi:hypothetical protein